MKKCSCGFKTWNKRRFAKHTRQCGERHGWEAKEVNTEGQAVETELVEVEEEGIDYEKMNIHDLRTLAREQEVEGIYGKNKAELIEALKEGE